MKKCNCGSCGEQTNTQPDGAVALECSDTSCSCGHDHQDHAHDHEHSHSHDHGQLTSTKQDVASIVLAAVLGGGSLLVGSELVSNILMGVAILIVGLPIFWEGLKNIVKLDLEELALLTIAVTAAVIIGELPEALLVTLLFRVGNLLEDIAVSRSRREVEAITQIIPDNANLLAEDGSVRAVSAKELAIGSKIQIKVGERVPVDSLVLSGTSLLDTSSLTGESAPREVQPGDAVLSGMVNTVGVLTCETTNTFDNSTASKIVEMVKDSAAKKGQTEKLISKFARIYTPIVILLALVVALVPPAVGLGSLSQWVSRSLVFLVASCPCALVISIPLSFFAGIGASSKNGILIKGSKYMEALSKAEAVVFDKTGTLTTGKLAVTGVYPVDGVDQGELLRLAAICESYSNHPIAKAVVGHVGSVDTGDVNSCEEITAHGMKANMADGEVLCGSARLMERYNLDVDHLPAANVYVAKNGAVMGAVTVSDQPRPDASSAIKELRELGVKQIAMLTGDTAAAAQKTAQAIGVDTVKADLLPADKVGAFETIKSDVQGNVLFVGDGINDSPVLAQADAGVAMGLAADAAIEAADVVLLSNKLASLPQAIRISRRTSRLARFNIAFALGVKLLVFVLAVLGTATMWMAVFADVGVSILSVLNATRALRFK